MFLNNIDDRGSHSKLNMYHMQQTQTTTTSTRPPLPFSLFVFRRLLVPPCCSFLPSRHCWRLRHLLHFCCPQSECSWIRRDSFVARHDCCSQPPPEPVRDWMLDHYYPSVVVVAAAAVADHNPAAGACMACDPVRSKKQTRVELKCTK